MSSISYHNTIREQNSGYEIKEKFQKINEEIVFITDKLNQILEEINIKDKKLYYHLNNDLSFNRINDKKISISFNSRKEEITQQLDRNYEIDTEFLNELLLDRINMTEIISKNISENTVETALNYKNEIYDDLYEDIIASKFNEKNKFKIIFENELIFSIPQKNIRGRCNE